MLEVDDWFVELGGQLQGLVELPGAEGQDRTAERIREVRVALRYETDGRGDTDRWTGPAQIFPVNVDGSLHGRFDLTVPPDGPVSYDGSLFRVRWMVEARTDLRLRLDKKTALEIVVLPVGGHGFYRQPHPLPPISH